MIETILLDIDGVCNTFQHHVFNCLGLLTRTTHGIRWIADGTSWRLQTE